MPSVFLKVWLINPLDRKTNADGVLGMGIAATAVGLVAGSIAAIVTAARKKWKIIFCKWWHGCYVSFDQCPFPQKESVVNFWWIPFYITCALLMTLLETTCREVICRLPNSHLLAMLIYRMF